MKDPVGVFGCWRGFQFGRCPAARANKRPEFCRESPRAQLRLRLHALQPPDLAVEEPDLQVKAVPELQRLGIDIGRRNRPISGSSTGWKRLRYKVISHITVNPPGW
jgi:hypothetical protein